MKTDQPEFIVAFMIGLVVCAAAVAALIEIRARRKKNTALGRVGEWLKNFLFAYTLPALLLGVVAAYCFTTFVLVPYFPGSISDCDLRDRACVARVDRARNIAAMNGGRATVEFLALAYIAFAAWRRTAGRKVSPYEIRLDDALLARIDARFPPALIFRFPEEVAIYFDTRDPKTKRAKTASETIPLLGENHAGLWEAMLRRYPNPPKTEDERQQREDEFWRRYAKRFTKTSADGGPALAPKPDLLIFFSAYEKWVFRDYFAATGTVIKTITEAMSDAILESMRADRMTIYSDDPQREAEKRRLVEKAREEETRVNEKVETHMKNWGGWFALNIETAFKKKHGLISDFGPQSATSPHDHPASDELAHKPNL